MNINSLLKNKEARKFAANTGWLVFDKVFHMVLSLVVTSMTARYLGTRGLWDYQLWLVIYQHFYDCM